MFKQGQILMLELYEYSDFGYAGPFRVLKDFEKPAAVEAYAAMISPGRQDANSFIAWLARERYIEDIEVGYWYLGETEFAPLDFVDSDEQDNEPLSHRKFTLTPEAKARHDAWMEAIREKRRKEYEDNPMARMTTGVSGVVIGG